MLLTRLPLYSQDCSHFLVRLACVRHAASVDSEPGSNSPFFLLRVASANFIAQQSPVLLEKASAVCLVLLIFQESLRSPSLLFLRIDSSGSHYLVFKDPLSTTSVDITPTPTLYRKISYIRTVLLKCQGSS